VSVNLAPDSSDEQHRCVKILQQLIITTAALRPNWMATACSSCQC